MNYRRLTLFVFGWFHFRGVCLFSFNGGTNSVWPTKMRVNKHIPAQLWQNKSLAILPQLIFKDKFDQSSNKIHLKNRRGVHNRIPVTMKSFFFYLIGDTKIQSILTLCPGKTQHLFIVHKASTCKWSGSSLHCKNAKETATSPATFPFLGR